MRDGIFCPELPDADEKNEQRSQKRIFQERTKLWVLFPDHVVTQGGNIRANALLRQGSTTGLQKPAWKYTWKATVWVRKPFEP